MSDRVFLDTNVLVYAYDLREPAKQARAQQILSERVADDSAVLSAQVLGEFFVTVTRKIAAPMTVAQARDVIDLVGVLSVVGIDRALTKQAISLLERYQINYWDALILAAADRGGCPKVLSEDLQHGQSYAGIVVENPFVVPA